MVAICLSKILLGGWVRVSYHPKFGIWSFETDLYTLLFAGVLVNGIVIIIFYWDKFCRQYTSCKEFLDEKRKDFADFLILRQNNKTCIWVHRDEIFVYTLFMNEFMSAAFRPKPREQNKITFKNIIIAGASSTYFQKSYFGKNPYVQSKWECNPSKLAQSISFCV